MELTIPEKFDRQTEDPKTGSEVGPPGSVPKVMIPFKLFCPHCGARHVEWDGGDRKMRWERRTHTTHRCRSCGGDFDVYVSGASDEDLHERTRTQST